MSATKGLTHQVIVNITSNDSELVLMLLHVCGMTKMATAKTTSWGDNMSDVSFCSFLKGSFAPKRTKINYCSSKMNRVVLAKHRCNSLSLVSALLCSPASPEFMEVLALDGRFITLVSAQTQTDWEWVEQSLSFSCQGKPCHQFGCEGVTCSCPLLPLMT